MKTADLRAILRSKPSRPVPPDLRYKLVAAIPDVLPFEAPASAWMSRRRWAYAAAAACLVAAALHFGGWRPWSAGSARHSASASLSLVPAAFANVVENLRQAGALVIELEQRTSGRENFEHVDPASPFVPVHVWLERPSARFAQGRMRVEKPDRRVVFNGQSTLFYFSPVEEKGLSAPGEAKVYPGGRIDAQLSDPARWLEDNRGNAQAKVTVDTVKGTDGSPVTRLTIEEKGVELAGGYEPWFYDQFDRRTVVCWNGQSGVLTDLEKHVRHAGQEVMVVKLRSIEYRDRLEDRVFSHDLPEGTHLQALADPGSQRYSNLGPAEVARTFFNAWKEKDWDTVRLFCDNNLVLVYMRLTELQSFKITGEPFKRDPRYAGFHVPYELVFANGVKKHALAVRNDNPEKRWMWDGGL